VLPYDGFAPMVAIRRGRAGFSKPDIRLKAPIRLFSGLR
jgi:hypothetical protein